MDCCRLLVTLRAASPEVPLAARQARPATRPEQAVAPQARLVTPLAPQEKPAARETPRARQVRVERRARRVTRTEPPEPPVTRQAQRERPETQRERPERRESAVEPPERPAKRPARRGKAAPPVPLDRRDSRLGLSTLGSTGYHSNRLRPNSHGSWRATGFLTQSGQRRTLCQGRRQTQENTICRNSA